MEADALFVIDPIPSGRGSPSPSKNSIAPGSGQCRRRPSPIIRADLEVAGSTANHGVYFLAFPAAVRRRPQAPDMVQRIIP